ncbi:MAG TPA: glycosyltransferase [Chloroflexota bacterium]|nr:glycosyltransferase [Chloroflexota bacterium]
MAVLERFAPPARFSHLRSAPECPVCGELRRSYLFVVRGLPVARCPSCGLVSLSPQPSPDDLASFYRDSELIADPRIRWSDSLTERDAAEQYGRALRERGVKAGRILLVAPPFHSFAETENVVVERQVTVRDLESGVTLEKNAFDAAIVLYQLEQAMDPARVLAQVFAALRADGILLLAAPSLDSWPARFFGDSWTEWRPENLFYFDRSILQRMLLKTGFADVSIDADRRRYTLRHIHDRAEAFPRTNVTRLARLLYPLLPAPLRDVRVRLATSGMVVTARKGSQRTRPLVSIVMPVYNERETFQTLMEAVLAKEIAGADKEIIVVESNSRDGTRDAVLEYRDHPRVRIILEDRPRGKGHAVRTGLSEARGDIVLIQDADLEYDINDYDALVEPLLSHRAAFVLGARHGGSWKMRKFADEQGLSTALNLGHVFFTTLLNVLYRQRMSDPFTMFKVFYRDCLHGLHLECDRFDFDHELVIKLVRKGYRPLEIPVNYRSRSFKEGKKVRMFRDPITWLWVDLKYRFGSATGQ